jgi:ABC-2 type transport system permease protein
MMGLVISTQAKSQFQAMQMTFFFFLPSILLSGFMFPFDGMPLAAQYLAEILPLTHFVRLIRGVILKGASLGQMMGDVYALFLFTFVMLMVAIARFKKRLE